MKKVVITITGIRPDFIRMKEIFQKLDKSKTIKHILVHTGQHYNEYLSDIFFQELKIRTPDYNLGIGGDGNEHYHQLANLSVRAIELIRNENLNPDIVLFLGDSNSSLASIPLKKEGYKIGHIEAGMRSHDSWMPEEINRVACDHVSDYLFAYHTDNQKNLERESVKGHVEVVGNTIVEICTPFLKQISVRKKKQNYILVDIHRHENIINPIRLRRIVSACYYLQKLYNIPIYWLDFPRTKRVLVKYGISIESFEIKNLMSYQQYLEAVYNTLFLISDSGTAQEEPALFGTPVIVPRSSTERPQSLLYNCSVMLDVSQDVFQVEKQLKEITSWVDDHIHGISYSDFSWLGDGNTSERIVKFLEENL